MFASARSLVPEWRTPTFLRRTGKQLRFGAIIKHIDISWLSSQQYDCHTQEITVTTSKAARRII